MIAISQLVYDAMLTAEDRIELGLTIELLRCFVAKSRLKCSHRPSL